jgi:hypothetical protein
MLETTVQVEGAKAVLSALRELEPAARRQAYAKIKQAGGELVRIGGDAYPRMRPLRNWAETGRLGWRTSAVVKGVQLQVGGRQPRGAGSFAIATLVNRNAAAGLFDIAGNAGGSKAKPGPRNRSQAQPPFHQLLQGYGRPAGRGIGKNLPRLQDAGYKAIVQALEEVAATVNRKVLAA